LTGRRKRLIVGAQRLHNRLGGFGMSPMAWIFVPVFALVTIGWIVNTWIRAKHGYPLDDGAGNPVSRTAASADDIAAHVKHALATRDATIAKLEERVRILERIVTDDSRRLAKEIESLRT
jgi:hypothetical protein